MGQTPSGGIMMHELWLLDFNYSLLFNRPMHQVYSSVILFHPQNFEKIILKVFVLVV